ncbi:metal-dependent transcriptional regulator [Acetomicrobium sp.]|jgi:DtxR family Mn-dependent transcriptional regulator|uniref:metal-dependent transcriptional regulator n=1 Tax=Acetomicrobium sp. TaxID=1872099 RepID=UPI002B25CA6A|nr:metal-dependent transcriptional regulator [Acetomicrobium sp.]
MSRLTPRKEDYIKAIYKLSERNRAVRIKDIAQVMGVRAPTVVGIVSMLKEDGYVEQEPYGYLELTALGREKAKTLIQKEQLIYKFFEDVLELPSDEAKDNACAIEHYISPICLERFLSFIEFLSTCPHAKPKFLEHFRKFINDGDDKNLACVACCCHEMSRESEVAQ